MTTLAGVWPWVPSETGFKSSQVNLKPSCKSPENTDIHNDKDSVRATDRQTNSQTKRQTNRQTQIKTDRDRQTDIYIYIYITYIYVCGLCVYIYVDRPIDWKREGRERDRDIDR